MLTVLLIFAALVESAHLQKPCISRDYGNGGTVCVCNSTYCDTIPRPERINSFQFWIYTSNMAGLRFQQSRGTFAPLDCCSSQIEIKSSVKFQTMFGFGGAFTDSTGINIHTLSRQAQELLLQTYFSENGIEYSLCRVPIGGTDFSVRAYSYDDGPPDPLLLNFKLAPEDYHYKIPYIKWAMNLTGQNLRLFGSAWTAPKWMKTNHMYSGFGFIRREYYESWASYFLKFLQEYQTNGVRIWGITTGNEPSDAYVPNDRLEVVGWPWWAMGTWIKENLGPTIRNSSHCSTKIMILDDQRAFVPWYVQKALRDPIARGYIDGIAVHWYLDQYFSPALLTQTHELFPEKFILSTEASEGSEDNETKVLLGSWERGENYSTDIIEDVLNWAVGWVDWNMALNLQGGPNYIQNYVDSPIIINASSCEFYKQPMYYHLGHFSKFVPRGSMRIEVEVTNSSVEVAAFERPDGGTAVVILNKEDEEGLLYIKDCNRGIAQVEVTARSIITLLYW